MEYVQTALVQIPANKLDDALAPQGLISELEAHRDFAAGQRGFLGMRVTRTANPEGNVLVVAETRWSNNNTMADYSTLRNNVESIIRRHESETIPGSLQVHRMESAQSETAEAPNRVYDRLALALFIPVGILAFALLVIYAMSRIYLTLPSAAATPLAAGIALSVLGISWYFASNPAAPRWQIAAVGLVVVATLGVGGTAAAVYDDNNHTVKPQETPVAVVSAQPGGTPAAPGAAEIDMKDNTFTTPNVTAKSGVTINVKNSGTAIHNVHVAPSGTSFGAAFCAASGPDPCSKPAAVPGGGSGTLVVTLSPGTYNYRCDFHPDQMKGTLTIQ